MTAPSQRTQDAARGATEPRFEVLIVNTATLQMSTGDYNLREQEAIALRQRLNAGNLNPNYRACEIPITNETKAGTGPDQAAASPAPAQPDAR